MTLEIHDIMQVGITNRMVHQTYMSESSSRSHSIFTIVVECMTSDERGETVTVGRLNMLDLAGSETQHKVWDINSERMEYNIC
jgi:hypothetical protein